LLPLLFGYEYSHNFSKFFHAVLAQVFLNLVKVKRGLL
jgi:hypothetical protein